MLNPNTSPTKLVLSVNEKVQNRPQEIMVGDGDRQFMLSVEEQSRVVHLIDPRTGETINLQIKDKTSSETTVRGKIDELVFESIHDRHNADSRSITIETHELRREFLSRENSFRIVNLPEGTVISRIEIIIEEPFISDDVSQHSIRIEGENGEMLMPDTWSDPNEPGCYSSSMNYVVGPEGFIRVIHDLNNTTSGSGSLKIHEIRPESDETQIKRTVG